MNDPFNARHLAIANSRMRVVHSVLAVGIALGLAFTALAAEGQQSSKVYRVGYLQIATASEGQQSLDAFRQALRELGYVQGQNVLLEVRSADGKPERLPDLATDLVLSKMDLIVATSGVAALSAKDAAPTMPIVMTASGDAVRQGLVASLARPGGNVTGLTSIAPETSQKRLQVLHEMLPRITRIGVLWCGSGAPVAEREWIETRAAARFFGLQLSSLVALDREGLADAFTSAAKQRVQAVVMFDCSFLNPSVDQIVELSLKHRLPVMYPYVRMAEAGGLVSYGPDQRELSRRAATYVDKILKGARPGDLPVEQPTKFMLAINLHTAKALGLTIPQSLLLRADEVIQ